MWGSHEAGELCLCDQRYQKDVRYSGRLVQEKIWRGTGPGYRDMFPFRLPGRSGTYCIVYCRWGRHCYGAGSMLSCIWRRSTDRRGRALLYALKERKWLYHPASGYPGKSGKKGKAYGCFLSKQSYNCHGTGAVLPGSGSICKEIRYYCSPW